jgi:transcriptional regulator with XRE-family HTH domain
MPRRIPRSKKSSVAVALGRVLREKRTAAGLSQERFAELVDLSKNYIGNLERGEYEISITVLDRVANALHLKASDLMKSAGF